MKSSGLRLAHGCHNVAPFKQKWESEWRAAKKLEILFAVSNDKLVNSRNNLAKEGEFVFRCFVQSISPALKLLELMYFT